MKIKTTDFLEQFEDYSKECSPVGVRLPKVEIDKDVQKEYELIGLDNPHDILRQICRVGYKNRRLNEKPNKQEYIDRINYELDTLKKLGFSQYIVSIFDLIKWADKNKIARGFGRGCLTSGASVKTKHEYKNINNIKVGDSVLDSNGVWQTVKNTFEYDIQEDLVEFEVGKPSFNKFQMTLDHKVLCIKQPLKEFEKLDGKGNKYFDGIKKVNLSKYLSSEKLEWEKAEDIQKWDYFSKAIDYRVIRDFELVDLSKHTDFPFDDNKIYETVPSNEPHKLRSKTIRDASGIDTRVLYRFKKGCPKIQQKTKNRIISYLHSIGETERSFKEFNPDCQYQIDRFLKVDEDLCKIIGIYLGDGWTNGKRSVAFAFNNTTKYKNYLFVKKYFEDKGYRTYSNHHKDKNLIQFYVYSNCLTNYFSYLDMGEKEFKSIPEDFYNLPDEKIYWLIRGLMESDGSEGAKRSFDNSSIKLARQTQSLLEQTGYVTSINIRIPTQKGWKKNYKVTICDNGNSDAYNDGKYIYIKVKGIRIDKNVKTKVYDLEVNQNPSYHTDQYIVHNSLGGAIIAYLLELTEIDPVKHGLIFERFINESRAQFKMIDGEQWTKGDSLPDADLDFSELERDRVVEEYLEVKYKNRISHISTVSTLSTKIILKEVCKKFGGYSEQESNKISSLVESDAGKLDSIEETKEKNDNFRKWADEHTDLYKISLKLCDLPRHFGTHAAGIITAFNPIFDSLPLEIRKDSKGNELLVECYSKNDVAEFEVKLDILGLSCLDVIYNTAKDVGFDLKLFDYEDPFIYEQFRNLELKYGLFQIEGDTGFRVVQKVKPDNFDEISDILAIARPGALAFLDQYVETKQTGEVKSIYPSIDKILVGTKGVILYQEDLMRLIHEVYGFSLLEADAIRKIVGKKLIEKVAEWEDKIKKAGEEKGIPEEATQLFWETVQASAKYSFNKSHSQSYAYISVLTTYLKFKYPTAFFKNSLISKPEKIQEITKELPYFGIKLKPPNLVKSNDDFSIDGNDIRYGLKNIKGLQEKGIAKLKNFNADVKNKFQLFQAAKEAGINIGILNNLIKAGCLSSFGENRGLMVLEASCWNLLTEAQKTKIYKFGQKYDFNLLSILADIKDGKLLDDGKEIISTKKRISKNHPEGNSSWDTFYSKYLVFKKDWAAYSKRKEFYNYLYEFTILGFAYSNKLHQILKKDHSSIIHLGDVAEAPIDSIVTSCGIVQEAKLGKTTKGNPKLTMVISDEFATTRIMMFDFSRYNREDHSHDEIKNVTWLKEEYKRYPEKGDVILFRGSAKERVVFADKIKILNLDYVEKT